jgi:hypothetical protein
MCLQHLCRLLERMLSKLAPSATMNAWDWFDLSMNVTRSLIEIVLGLRNQDSTYLRLNWFQLADS